MSVTDFFRKAAAVILSQQGAPDIFFALTYELKATVESGEVGYRFLAPCGCYCVSTAGLPVRPKIHLQACSLEHLKLAESMPKPKDGSFTAELKAISSL